MHQLTPLFHFFESNMAPTSRACMLIAFRISATLFNNLYRRTRLDKADALAGARCLHLGCMQRPLNHLLNHGLKSKRSVNQHDVIVNALGHADNTAWYAAACAAFCNLSP
jgi:hypothetical protein